MKQGRTILASLLTAAVVLGGFFLPNLVAAVQARTVQPVQVEMGPAQLFSSSELSLHEKLELMSNAATYVQSIEVEIARYLAVEEAEQLANAYAMGFAQVAMEAAAVECVSVTPYYNIFTNSGKAFYVWECYFQTNDGSGIRISLDDETGDLLQLIWMRGKMTTDKHELNERFEAARDYLAETCAAKLNMYYDSSDAEPNEQYRDENGSTAQVGQVMYCHLYDPETDDLFDIPVWHDEYNFSFNMFP